MNAIELRGVTKRFGSTAAVQDLDLVVPSGAIHGFIGPNGSGKTTTLRMVLRILYPDEGSISVLGERGSPTNDARVGYLPEERGLYRRMKVLDALRFFVELRSGSSHEGEIRRWLDRFDLGSWSGRKIDALSKGMAQKVQFIVAAVPRPELLILDEPFSGLDPVNLETLRAAILELRAQGTTVVLSTHDMAVAESMCDFIFMIYRGCKVLDGTLASVRRQFGDDTIRLCTTGGREVLKRLPGVEACVDRGQFQELRLAPGAEPQEILRLLLERTQVRHFELAQPSLHEIFVRIAHPEPEPTHA